MILPKVGSIFVYTHTIDIRQLLGIRESLYLRLLEALVDLEHMILSWLEHFFLWCTPFFPSSIKHPWASLLISRTVLFPWPDAFLLNIAPNISCTSYASVCISVTSIWLNTFFWWFNTFLHCVAPRVSGRSNTSVLIRYFFWSLCTT